MKKSAKLNQLGRGFAVGDDPIVDLLRIMRPLELLATVGGQAFTIAPTDDHQVCKMERLLKACGVPPTLSAVELDNLLLLAPRARGRLVRAGLLESEIRKRRRVFSRRAVSRFLVEWAHEVLPTHVEAVLGAVMCRAAALPREQRTQIVHEVAPRVRRLLPEARARTVAHSLKRLRGRR